MPQSLSKVFIHIIFSTKNRYPFLQPEVRDEMHRYIAGICSHLKCHPQRVNGTADHVHIVCELSRTIPISKLFEEIKRNSSRWVKTKGQKYQKFFWQNGYGVFSVGKSQLPTVIKYVEGQEEHHRRKSFQEEYRKFLLKYEVNFDERYVWD